MTDDYYSTLGVSKDATKEEIRRAYKQLAKKYHPDISKEENAEEKLKEINEAYSILGDSEKRSKYDQYGSAAFDESSGFGNAGFSGFSQGFNFSHIFSSFMDEDPFSSFSNFKRSGRRRVNLDLKKRVVIDFMEAAKGVTKKIELTRDQKCEKCDGTGSKSMKKNICSQCHGKGQVFSTRKTPFGMFSVQQVCPKCHGEGQVIEDPCPYCSGKGYVSKSSQVSVKIPEGINNNNIIKLAGLGNVHNNYKGDLYIQINVREHDLYKRDGADLYLELPLTYTSLLMGTQIKIKGIRDNIKLKIPKNTKTGTIFKIKGKGLKNINNRSAHGDLFIKVFVIVPQKCSRKYKTLIKKLKELEDKEIQKQINEDYKEILN